MCGIVGIYAYHVSAPPVDRGELVRIRDSMYRRGPDDEGEWISADVRIGLGSRRLAIIDLSPGGAQPMVSVDGRYRIVFNGEIYNYRELRASLQRKGFEFRSESDTEVLLNLYADQGAAMTDSLRGMYAFAILDQKDNSLFLARDPFGIKPLYLLDDGKTIRFASQVKALLNGGAIRTKPSAAGYAGFFLWGHVPDPFTLHDEIRALPAGTSMRIDRHGCARPKGFFDISTEFLQASEGAISLPGEERRARVHEVLRDSVKHHLIADVPVGVFLSSGLDSTTLAALSAEMAPDNIHTLTLGFDEYRGTQNDETRLAEAIALQYGTTHRTMWVSKSDFEVEFDRVLESMDQPSIDGVNTYFVSRAAAAAGMKVALSGLGGDELFGGYPSFREIPRIVRAARGAQHFPTVARLVRKMTAPLLGRIISPKFAGLLEYGGTRGGAYLLRRGLFMPWELGEVLDESTVRDGLEQLCTIETLNASITGIRGDFQAVSALELQWYMRNQLLRDSDWAGMAHSVEIRVPFVDVDVFRALAPLMTLASLTKAEMSSAPSKPLPASVLNRKKTGFSIPVREWFQQIDARALGHRGMRSWARKVIGTTPRKERVLALVTDAFGGYGGISLYNRDFLSAVCAYPGTLEVVALPRLMPNAPEPYPPKLKYETAGLNGKLSYVLAMLRILISDRKFGLIVCGHINLLPLAYFAHVISGAPILLLIFGIDAWRPTDSLLVNRLVSRILAYVSISKVTQDRFSAWADTGSAQSFILPNAIHLDAYCPGSKDPDLERRYNISGKKVIMTVGRLVSAERSKGFDEVLEGLPQLLREDANLVYVIVGDGSDRVRLEKKVQALGIERNVVFAGLVTEAEKPDVFRLADVFVMASRGEGFGFVILEALATGIPTVASKIDGGREAIRDGAFGILVDPDDSQDVIRGIREALNREKGIPVGLDYFSYQNFEIRLHTMLDKWRPMHSIPTQMSKAVRALEPGA